MAIPRPLVLCADDFALTEAVSAGILALIAEGRLGATSAMTNRPAWPLMAREVASAGPSVAIGLHLNLTLGDSLSGHSSLLRNGGLKPLPSVVRGALAGRLPASALKDEIAAQLDAFEQAMGRTPDFIDGHQHVHSLPGVRGALLEVLARRAPGHGASAALLRGPWLRDPADSMAAIRRRGGCVRKALLVKTLANGFGLEARAAGFITNRGFAGFSAFLAEGRYEREFQSFLLAPGSEHMVMCHPGRHDETLRGLDPAIESRARELAFLSSSAFADIYQAAGFRLAPHWG